jgi:hypothetical protein
MGTDRFISFSKEHPCPPIEDVETALRSYLTEAGEVTRHHPELVIATLHGRSSIIASGFPGNENLNDPTSERFFEVNITGGQMDVITRRGDEYTCALADGFMGFAIRYWNGVLEDW